MSNKRIEVNEKIAGVRARASELAEQRLLSLLLEASH